MKLDTNNQFVTLEGKALGVYVHRAKNGRYRYRMQNGTILASGMPPTGFVKSFWGRDDFIE